MSPETPGVLWQDERRSALHPASHSRRWSPSRSSWPGSAVIDAYRSALRRSRRDNFSLVRRNVAGKRSLGSYGVRAVAHAVDGRIHLSSTRQFSFSFILICSKITTSIIKRKPARTELDERSFHVDIRPWTVVCKHSKKPSCRYSRPYAPRSRLASN